MLSIKYQFYNFKLVNHSSGIRGLCLRKWPEKILQNLPSFWNTIFCISFIIFILCNFFPNNHGKFWRVSLVPFIKHIILLHLKGEITVVRTKQYIFYAYLIWNVSNVGVLQTFNKFKIGKLDLRTPKMIRVWHICI